MIHLPKNINLGGCLEYKSNKYDVEIEAVKFDSVAYAFDEIDKMSLTSALEKSVLKILEELENKLLKIHIIDFDVSRKYQNLNLIKHPSNIINYIDSNTIKDSLKEIENTVIEYNNDYLNNGFSDICSYNKENNDFPLSYNIVIVNFDYLEINNEYYSALHKLLNQGRRSGVLFFFQFKSKSIAQEIAESRQKATFNNKHRIEFLELILKKSIVIYRAKDRYAIQNAGEKLKDVFNRFTYNPQSSDVEQITSTILTRARQIQKKSKTKNFLSIPIGKKGRQTYSFELGLKATSYHAFIGGDTGMGKSNFINNLIVQIAETYSPDDIRLVLLDLKGGGGTEFQFYKKHPNVETLVLTSKLDILEKVITDFTNELNIRTRLFNENMVKTVEEYREKTEKKLPYKLMIIDEVQELFGSSWKTTNLFNSLLDKIGRQGRAYGIHLILSTQSLTDVNISNSILNNLKLRIAFKLSNLTDCRKIMDSRGNNELPYNIEPYEVVYNNDLGKAKNNQHFLTTEIKTNTINKRLDECNFKKELFFEMEIYTEDTLLKKNNETKVTEYQPIKQSNKGELNLDDY